MHELVEDGQTFYWGTTEWPASMIVTALGVCEKNNWHKPVLVQPRYSATKREYLEKDLFYVLQDHKIGAAVMQSLSDESAKAFGKVDWCDPKQLSLAWAIANQDVSVALMDASSTEHITQ